jgi:hypothetical protein
VKTNTAAEAAQLANTDPHTLEKIELLERCIEMCSAQMEQANNSRLQMLTERHHIEHDRHAVTESKMHYYTQWDETMREVVADYRCYRRLRSLAQAEMRLLFPIPERLESANFLNAWVETVDPMAILCRRPSDGA